MIGQTCVGECMKRDVVTVRGSTTVEEAVSLVVEKHIGTLPVVDVEGVLIGVVRLVDLLRVFMPDFVNLLDNIDFVHDFGALEEAQPHAIPGAEQLTMEDLAVPPVSVDQEAGLLHALATLVKRELQDLPIVDEKGRLVGIASRVDIAVAFFAARQIVESRS